MQRPALLIDDRDDSGNALEMLASPAICMDSYQPLIKHRNHNRQNSTEYCQYRSETFPANGEAVFIATKYWQTSIQESRSRNLQ